MKKIFIAATFFVVPFLPWQPPAKAEMFTLTNRISEIGVSRDYMKVYRLNPDTQSTEEVKIGIQPGTLFRGAESIRSFKVGDVVAVVADQDPYTHESTARLVEPVQQPG